MSFIRKFSRIPLALALMPLVWLSTQANAQEQQARNEQPQQPTSTLQGFTGKERSAVGQQSERDDATLNRIEQLSKRVEQLQALVEQQQLSLLELQKRLDEGRAQPVALNGTATREPGSASRAGDSGNQADGINSSAVGATTKPSQGGSNTQETSPILAGWDGNHAFLRSADGNFETNLTGYAQLDFRGYQRGNHPPNTFLIRRARLSLEGKLFRYFDYKLEGDFADTTSTLLRDFYVRVHRADRLQLTFGQFREPYSQEEIRPDAVQDFVERSLANNLAPSRSPGVMVSGVLRKGIFEYQVGAFNGKGLLANNAVGTPEGAVRLRFAPWKNTKGFLIKGITFGGAYALGRNSTTGTSVRGQTESRSFIFFTPDTVNGPITRANGELTWLAGPAAFRAEYDQTNQARNRLGAGGTTLPGVVAKGYAGQFTYLLTGENKSESGAVTPKRNLFGDENGRPGYGAWELKVRYSSLQIADGTAKSNRAYTIFFGANWYLNRFVRYLFDFGFESYKDPLRTPQPGDREFGVILNRVQVAF